MGHEPGLVQGGLPVGEHEVPVLHMPVDGLARASIDVPGPVPTSPFVARLAGLVPCQQGLPDCNALLRFLSLKVRLLK